MHQSPAAGERVTDEDLAQGFIITVTISKGPRMRELPNTEGSPLKEASETIAAQGLLGTVEYQYSDKYNEGIVVGYKDKSVGETVEYGTNVTFIVSKGKGADWPLNPISYTDRHAFLRAREFILLVFTS